jgi:phytoene dehydrogenase-like protein
MGHAACVSVALPSLPPDDAPDAPAALWPLVLRWAESDDARRGQLIDAAADHDLQGLVDRVRPTLVSINAYLDRTADAERAVPFGDLAQAALEAEQALDGRP